MTDENNESPEEQPTGGWRFGDPSCGCLTFGAVGLVVLTLLYLIYWPSYWEAQTPSRVARAKSDMRKLGVALEAYAVDRTAYPSYAAGARGVNESAKPNDPAGAITTFATHSGAKKFLTPLASESETSRFDIFSVSRKTYYGYYTTGKSWVLFSAGPDLVYDVPDPARRPTAADGDLDPKQFLDLTYDASNGTHSRGDIFLFGGKAKDEWRPPSY